MYCPLLIPAFQALPFLYLLLWKGDEGTNEYGPQPESKLQNPFSMLALGKLNKKEWQNLIIIVIIILGFSGYMYYEGQKYWQQKNQVTSGIEDSWTEFTSDKGNFKILLPQTTPNIKDNSDNNKSSQTYTALGKNGGNDNYNENDFNKFINSFEFLKP
ncbi:DUF805 domain-containing protein [Candidatus Peregrinibacteria bacterium]|nr:DUF805 domain-containing protein [Candidatus Peregrinibacteria bacterium]